MLAALHREGVDIDPGRQAAAVRAAAARRRGTVPSLPADQADQAVRYYRDEGWSSDRWAAVDRDTAVLRGHLLALTARTGVLDGIEDLALVDIDSLLRPVYGHAKQGASFGHTKIANRQVLRKGLSPLVTTISTGRSAPVIAGIRLRAGKAGSGKGAASMVTEAINTAKAAGAKNILVRGDSAYGNGKVIAAVVKAGAKFSFVLTKNQSVNRAIGAIADDAWTPVHYPGAVTDPDTGELISDAEVAEIEYTAFASTTEKITARLIVRRVRDRNHPDELFPVWRYHPFFTNSTEPVTDADITHRQHAIIESVFADVIDGPLAHLPSGSFPGKQRVDGARRDHPQPAPRRRHPRRQGPRGGPRGHPAPAPGQRPGPDRQTPGQTHPAPARALAPGHAHGKRCGTTPSPTTPDKSRPEPPSTGLQRPYQETTVEKLGRPAARPRPQKPSPRITQSARIQDQQASSSTD